MKYIFTVIFQPKLFKEVSKLMRKLDLNIEEIVIEKTFTFTGNDVDIEFMKQKLIEVFESEDLTVLKIEGGKIQ